MCNWRHQHCHFPYYIAPVKQMEEKGGSSSTVSSSAKMLGAALCSGIVQCKISNLPGEAESRTDINQLTWEERTQRGFSFTFSFTSASSQITEWWISTLSAMCTRSHRTAPSKVTSSPVTHHQVQICWGRLSDALWHCWVLLAYLSLTSYWLTVPLMHDRC